MLYSWCRGYGGSDCIVVGAAVILDGWCLHSLLRMLSTPKVRVGLKDTIIFHRTDNKEEEDFFVSLVCVYIYKMFVCVYIYCACCL